MVDINGVIMTLGDVRNFTFNTNTHFAGFVVDFFDTGSYFISWTLTGENFDCLIIDEDLGDFIWKDGVCYFQKAQEWKNEFAINSPTSGIVNGFASCEICNLFGSSNSSSSSSSSSS